MVYLKLYESFNEIDAICKKYGISNYTINSDGSIDVGGNVDLCNLELDLMKLTKLPLRFGKVSGNFNCSCNKLTSLEGCPKEVGGDFNCSNNQLTSLEGGPIKVGSNFRCNGNKLTTLKGSPIKVGDNFNCVGNKLTSLNGCPRQVGNLFLCNGNPIYIIYDLIEDIVYKDYFNLIEFVDNWDVIRPGKVIVIDRLNDYLENFGKEAINMELISKGFFRGYKCI